MSNHICFNCWQFGHQARKCKVTPAVSEAIKESILAELAVMYVQFMQEAQTLLDSLSSDSTRDASTSPRELRNKFFRRAQSHYNWNTHNVNLIVKDKFLVKYCSDNNIKEEELFELKCSLPYSHTAALIEARHPGITEKFRFLSNIQIAEEYKISRERARQIRGQLNIPSMAKLKASFLQNSQLEDSQSENSQTSTLDTPNDIKMSAKRAAKDVLMDHVHLLGVKSDRDIADMLALSINTVNAFRVNMGIAPFRTSPRSQGHVAVDRKKIYELMKQGLKPAQIAQQLGGKRNSTAQIMGVLRNMEKNGQFAMTPQVKELRDQGLSFQKIADRLGLDIAVACTLGFFF